MPYIQHAHSHVHAGLYRLQSPLPRIFTLVFSIHLSFWSLTSFYWSFFGSFLCTLNRTTWATAFWNYSVVPWFTQFYSFSSSRTTFYNHLYLLVILRTSNIPKIFFPAKKTSYTFPPKVFSKALISKWMTFNKHLLICQCLIKGYM